MARSRCSWFPAMAKASVALMAGAGVAAALGGRADFDLLPSFPDLSISTPAEKIRFVAEGVVRSSRALYSITFVVADYKYSLWGLDFRSDEHRTKLSEVHLRSAKRMLKLCETNKGFYVKAGQFVSSLRQVPKEYSSTLSTLQDNTVPCDFKDIKEVIVKNLGKDLSELFYSFDENPIAAASIAQVHHALLRDNQEVAVKVQYPGLRQRLTIDITTMSIISNSVASIFPEYKLKWMVSEFERSLSSELDFIQEAENAERTARNFRGQKTIKVPQIYWDLTTSQVLTMQFFHGRKVDDLEFLKGSGIDPGKVAKALIEIFSEMIFVHGFVHGDPHPGNILVSPEGPKGFSLVILDHGIYKELDESFRLDYCQLWKALILLDVEEIKKISERFGMGKYARYFPVLFTGRTMESKSALGKQMSAEEKRKLKQDLRALNMSDISSFMETMPSEFLTMLRTDGLLRSIMGKLGASGRVRLLTYAKYALHGLATKDKKENGPKYKHVIYKIRTSLSYIQLRCFLEILDTLSQLEDFRQSLVMKLKGVLREFAHFLNWSFLGLRF